MASVGIVTGDQCAGSAEEAVRNADVAMYEAKRAGRGCSVVFSETMHARLTRHLAIETSLRRAIGSDELYLEYETVMDLHSGREVGVEALVRWNHPTLGSITPLEFVPIAEESGLIVAIGQWMREAACRSMSRWRQLDAGNAPGTLSLNVSGTEIALGERLVNCVQSTLQSAGLPAECLQIEISEREVMRDPVGVRKLLDGLSRLGVRLAMDEFGAGHSSLTVLREYPFQTVKIDRSFLTDLDKGHEGLAVIGAALVLVRNLDMVSIAVGVETPAQVAILQSLGCDAAQGCLFGAPPAARMLSGPAAPGVVTQAGAFVASGSSAA